MNELNQPTQTYKPEGIPLTPYLKAKEIWDNRIGSARVQAYNWRLASSLPWGSALSSLSDLSSNPSKAVLLLTSWKSAQEVSFSP